VQQRSDLDSGDSDFKAKPQFVRDAGDNFTQPVFRETPGDEEDGVG